MKFDVWIKLMSRWRGRIDIWKLFIHFAKLLRIRQAFRLNNDVVVLIEFVFKVAANATNRELMRLRFTINYLTVSVACPHFAISDGEIILLLRLLLIC
jgi:hypothetical protein